MWKYCRNGESNERQFFISNDFKYLGWRKPSDEPFNIKNCKKSIDNLVSSIILVPLISIHTIILGRYTKVFKKKKHNNTKEFYLSFSLITEERTVDIVAKTTYDYEAWILGISSLLKLQPKWGKYFLKL